MDNLVNKIMERFGAMKTDRGNFEIVWQDIADYFIPNQDGITVSRSSGDNTKRRDLYDTTGGHSAEVLTASLHTGLTNPSVSWFDLSLMEKALETQEISIFFEMCKNVMMTKLNNSASSFPLQNHEFIFSCVTYGTAGMFLEYTNGKELKFSTVHINDLYVKEDKYGEIDTVFRKMCMTKRQLIARFGDKVHDSIKNNSDKELDKKITILHVVIPAAEAEVMKNKKFNYASYYIDIENKHIMSVGGYYENPYIIARFSKLPNETYGRSPAWQALPTARMLNAMNKSLIQGAQLQLTPPMLMADDGVAMPLQAKPNGIIYGGLSLDGSPRVQPLNVANNPQGLLTLIQFYQQHIRDIFFVDQASLSGQNSYRTATEVIQIQQEKFKLLAPYIFRLQTEYLTKLLDKLFNILARDGAFGEIPQDLIENEYEIIFTSPMAMLQKSADIQKFTQFLQLAAPMLQLNPNALDFVDFDKATRKIAQDIGLWASIQKSPEEVAQQRAQQQQQQQAMQAMVEAQAGSQVGVDMSTIAANLAKTQPDRVEITQNRSK